MTLQETLRDSLQGDNRILLLESTARGIIRADPGSGRVRVQLALENIRSDESADLVRSDITMVLERLSRRDASDSLI